MIFSDENKELKISLDRLDCREAAGHGADDTALLSSGLKWQSEDHLVRLSEVLERLLVKANFRQV